MKQPFLFYEIRSAGADKRSSEMRGHLGDAMQLRAIVAQITSAVEAGIRTLVLGAFGCGVFKNNPTEVAHMYRSVLDKYKEHFDLVYFAIYAPAGSNPLHAKNVKEFKDVFGQPDFSMKTILGGPFFDTDKAAGGKPNYDDFESLFRLGIFQGSPEAERLHQEIQGQHDTREMVELYHQIRGMFQRGGRAQQARAVTI